MHEPRRPPSRDWAKRALRGSHADPLERLLLVVMAVNGDMYGDCARPLSELAEMTGLSKRGVQNAISGLVELGELEQLRVAHGRGNPAKYRIVHPKPGHKGSHALKVSAKGGK